MEIKKVGICGLGLMGSGIAEVSSKAGVDVVAMEVNDDFLKKGMGRIDKSLSRAVAKDKLDEAGKKAILDKIKPTTDPKDLADCDLIVEAIIENFDEKAKLYKTLDGIVKKEAIFASNTSSLSITAPTLRRCRSPRWVPSPSAPISSAGCISSTRYR